MDVEARDLILIGLGALVFLALTRLPVRSAALPVDRSSLDALVAQLGALQQERAHWRDRAEAAEMRATQLQVMVDNLLPAAGNDKMLITALRERLTAQASELDQVKTSIGIQR